MDHNDNVKYNRLIHEKSPYLLQHAANPVDWYPWGEEAFQAAREQDKPIFLSIGYSTCHWCHVMEEESFSDSAVAALMNQAFINIKVDREERPDIDDIYMTVCQMMTGSGGWPLTIIMTPDKVPFFAATYIPKESRFGRMGMLDLIPTVQRMWENDRQRLLQTAEKVQQALQKVGQGMVGEAPGDSILHLTYQQLAERYDARHGGFGNAPKFPAAHNLMFLLRYYKRTGDAQALNMVEHTLTQMRLGGMYDQVGFGFHRYSTDEQWLVPHFEKMLYDQAALAIAYTEAYQLTRNPLFRQTAEEIFTYVLRDMTDPGGGFYSAEDADSEGEEGKFYLWTTDEIREVLGKKEGELFIRVFNLTQEGNFREEASRQLTGRNIPHLKKPLPEMAKELGLEEAELHRRLEAARQKLFEVREKRVHPLKDDKILTDWNGLMIAALAKAARAFDAPHLGEAATRAAEFVLNTLRTPEGRLMHRYRKGEVGITGYLDDYAFLIWGLLELYETTFDLRYLKNADELAEVTIDHFWDEAQGAFFFTPDDGEALLIRKKEIYDGAIPSGNSVMMLNLLRLGRITANPDLEKKAEAITRAFSGYVSEHPVATTFLMCGLDFATGPTHEVVIVGEPEQEDTRAMLAAIREAFLPNKVLLLRTSTVEEELGKIAPYTRQMTAVEGRATAYVCQNYACELPTTEVAKMRELLGLSGESPTLSSGK
ncbi:MAG: thioredoxin domain-containing protein [Calditrichaeota bacterium]|nr:MAG: thioredoxin domain-containing protein [Calditrichota bacterium]